MRHTIVKLLLALLLLYAASWIPNFEDPKTVWGLTFSQYYAAEELGLDWRETYRAVLDELAPAKIRLVAYWQYLEPSPGAFDFRDLDWQLTEAAARGIPVTLAIGYKVPRWPECHAPGWVRHETETKTREALKAYLTVLVTHYRGNPIIERWQVENEPLFRFFGVCPSPDREFLKEEVALVKSFDPTRPIVLTNSGEFSTWRETAGLTEVLGTTLYRVVWNQYTGWWTHLLPPSWYTLRGWIAGKVAGTKEVIISELQSEPWISGNRGVVAVSLTEQTERFKPDDLVRNVHFARATGFPEVYLWGAEWWYWRKLEGDPSFWEKGVKVFDTRGTMEI